MRIFAPLPDYSDLISGTWAATGGGSAPTAAWAVRDEPAAWFSSGTQILLHAVRAWAAEQGIAEPTVWFPDYFCDAATQLLRDQNIAVAFYPINGRLDPDWTACAALAGNGPPPDVFVLVHYFGRVGETGKAAEFCRERGAFLMEDAAHVLFPHGSMATRGDAIFYCQHKVLPTPDGALLVGRPPQVTETLTAKPSPLVWLFKRIAQKLMPDAVLSQRVRQLPGFMVDTSAPPPNPTWRPSALGQAMVNRYAPRLACIAESRKRAAFQWRRAFTPHAEVCGPYLGVDEEGPVPYRFILKCSTREVAEQCFEAFRHAGVAVESWPDLAPEVRHNRSNHEAACELRDTLIFFPVFNSLPENLGAIVDNCIRKALAR